MSDNVASTFVVTPADPQKTLGIKLPFLVMIIKNLKKYFSFEVQVLDDKNVRRRFRASNYQVGPCKHFVMSPSSMCILLHQNDICAAVDNKGEAFHLHHAHAAGRWVEPDPVQPV
jgi:hypothetical protein